MQRVQSLSKGWRAALCGALAVSLVAAACSKAPQSSGSSTPPTTGNELKQEEAPRPGGKLVVGVMAETTGWSPISALWADVDTFMASAVLEPLMMFDAQGSPQPWLAESVEPKQAGNFDDWIIKLKPGIKFHNGETLDANVVVRNLKLTSTESLAALATKDLFGDISAVDPLTVEVKLSRQWSAFPGAMANTNGVISANEALDMPAHGIDHPIGTGPFSFVSWQRDTSSKFRKFDGYWQKGQPYLDEIEFRPIVDNKQRAQALRSGDLDMIYTFSAEDAANLESEHQVVRDYYSDKTFVMINTAEDPSKAKNPLKNAHARKALAYATNVDELKGLFSGGQELQTTTSPLVSNSKWKIPEDQTGATRFDLDKAKAEVEAYRKETGESTISFKLTSLNDVDVVKLQQALQTQWKAAGIDVQLETADQSGFVSTAVLGGFQAAIFRNYNYVDPDTDYYFFHSSTAKGLGVLSVNFHQWKDAEADRLLDDARSTDDDARRKTDYEQLTRRINEANIDIWLYNTPYSIITNDKVKGLNQARKQPFGNYLPKTWLWTSIWKEKA